MPLFADLEKTVKFLETSWFEKRGFLAVCAAILFSELGLFGINNNINSIAFYTTTIGTLLILYLLWIYSNRLPVRPKDKVGFLVAIYCSEEQDYKKLQEDFILPLRGLIQSGQTGRVIHFMELRQPACKAFINDNNINKINILQQKTKAHFILYGSVKKRIINNTEHHIFQLDGIVSHRPISQLDSQRIANEFRELLPKQINISSKNDVYALEFTSEWASLVARYIIGIAAASSGDLNYAESLYSEALSILKSKQNNFPIYNKMLNRLPIRISELNEARAQIVYSVWLKTKDLNLIIELKKYLEKIDKSKESTLNYINLKAIYFIVKEHDSSAAIKVMKKHKDQVDPVWNYNIAFLYSYEKNFKLALRHYRKAVKVQVDPQVLAQIEDFMCFIIETHTDKNHLFYALGYFNLNAKGDKLSAKRDLLKFIELCNSKEFKVEINLANKWIQEMEN